MSTVSNVQWKPRTDGLRVQGDAGARGRAQGEALRDLIAEGVGRWLEAIGRRHGVDPDDYLGEFLAATGHVAAMKDLTPETLSEIEGIAAGQSATQSNPRLQPASTRNGNTARGGEPENRLVARLEGFVSQSGSAVIGQTMDIPSVHDGTQNSDGSRTVGATGSDGVYSRRDHRIDGRQ